MKKQTYLHWGLTIVLSVCAILVFYNTFFQDGVLFTYMSKLMTILKPVIYGLALAYLLAPVVNFFDRALREHTPLRSPGAVRALSILFTWAIVIFLLYLLFSMLIPELADSVKLLISNLESYYRTIYKWAVALVEKNPILSDQVLSAVRDYYNEVVDWVKNTLIPQAQIAIVAVTGGLVSVLVFVKDLLVGMVISIYVLARKETFAAHSRRLLYSAVSPARYARMLREVSTADGIFSGFVRGKLLDSLIIGVLCFVGCSIIGFPYTPIISVFVGVTNIIPIFGPFIGAIPSAFLILLVNPRQCLYFIIFIIALQQLDGHVIGPSILGKSTGLSSFWVIVAILVGGGFGGVLGMFLGVPIFACAQAAIKALSDTSLRKKGLTDEDMETMFSAGPDKPTTTESKEEISK